MRNRFLLAVLVILALLPGNLAWGQSNLPNNANAATVQGPDPTGMLGYPLATVPATGALPWPVAIQSFAASLCVTQCTSPWIVGAADGAIATLGSTSDAVPPGTPSVVAGGAGSNISQLRGIYAWLAHIADNQIGDPNSSYAGTDGTGQLASKLRTLIQHPDRYTSLATAATGNTNITGNLSWRLMRYQIEVTGNASLAAPGLLTVSMFDDGSAIGQAHDVYLPAVALNSAGVVYSSGWCDFGSGGYQSSSGGHMQVNLSQALVTGTVRVNVAWTSP